MNIKEVEDILQISRANIRFYEQEGLLNPTRGKNGYRDYSDTDLAQLKKIIFLRKLGISIADIKKYFDGDEKLSQIIDEQILSLKREMEELNGALHLCEKMAEDPSIDTAPQFDNYWEEMKEDETNGGVFFDVLKDFASFEADLFTGMWKRVFFYNMDRSVKKHGWPIAFLIVLGICILRGLFHQYVWHSGSFWGGFLYPFALFLAATAVLAPIFLIVRFFVKESTENGKSEHKTKRKIPLLGLWLALGAIAFLIILLFGIPVLLGTLIFEASLDYTPTFIVTGTPVILYVFASFSLFAAIMVFGFVASPSRESARSAGEKVRYIPTVIRRRVFAIYILVFLVSVVAYFSWYDSITEDGITRHHFVWTTHYEWDDVKEYEIQAAYDGTMRYLIRTKDGASFSLLGDSSLSEFDEDKYPDGDMDYLLQLTKFFTDQGVPMKVDNWEKLHRELTYEYWDDYANQIRAAAKK